MRLEINGITVSSEDYTGGKTTSVDIATSDDSGKRVRSVSQEYVISGPVYDLINETFIINPTGKLSFLPVKIYDDSNCCSEPTLIFEGILKGENVEWCEGECNAKCIFTEHTTETKKMDCIKSTLIYDDRNGFQNEEHPRMAYCNEMRPEFLQHTVLILAIMLNIVLFVLTPVVAALTALNAILEAIESAINLIPGANVTIAFDFNGDGQADNYLQMYRDLRDRINRGIIGCGRRHPSPLVRSYIKNPCDICGVGFSSSFLTNPASDYYNDVFINANPFKGIYPDAAGNIGNYIEVNKPIYTLEFYLNFLANYYNSRWELINNTIVFERKDYFTNGDTWINTSTILEDGRLLDNTVCYKWRQEEKPAAATFSYTADPIDVTGNEALSIFNDTVSWNEPFNEIQSGIKEYVFPLGTVRVRDDKIDEDVYAIYDWAPFGLGTQIKANNSSIIMEKGVAFNPKIVAWDGNMNYGRVRRFSVPDFGLQDDKVYNFPHMFNEHNSLPNTIHPVDHPQSGMYPRFFCIDNPKVIIDKGKTFEFTFYYKCGELQNSFNAKYVQLPIGVGEIKNMTIDLQDRTITVSGNV